MQKPAVSQVDNGMENLKKVVGLGKLSFLRNRHHKAIFISWQRISLPSNVMNDGLIATIFDMHLGVRLLRVMDTG